MVEWLPKRAKKPLATAGVGSWTYVVFEDIFVRVKATFTFVEAALEATEKSHCKSSRLNRMVFYSYRQEQHLPERVEFVFLRDTYVRTDCFHLTASSGAGSSNNSSSSSSLRATYTIKVALFGITSSCFLKHFRDSPIRLYR